MFQLKSLSKAAIPLALEKAERYRLLNEPGEAESICLDILEIEPRNQATLVMLLLAMTDSFSKSYMVGDAEIQKVANQLNSEYERAYYMGLVWERKAKARLELGSPESRFTAYDWLCEAMRCFEKAETLRPPGNDDAILRWNTCARIIMGNKLEAQVLQRDEQLLE